MSSASHHRQHNPVPSLTSTAPPKNAQQSLAKRLLFPAVPADPLPPLLAGPHLPPEFTPELYDFIALALRAYVNPWWSKISRYDKEFLPHISRILTTVLRTLEARLHQLDLAPLLFHDVPAIVTQHYRDYRNAESKLATSYASGGAVSLPQLFHQLQPHMALSPDGKVDQEYFRQIVDHILKACLPPEDYGPESERFIVREVILKVLLNDILPRITQPWFIHKSILTLLGQPEDDVYTPPPPPPATSPAFSFHNLLVIVLSALQSFSSVCLALIQAYKQAISTIKFVNQTPPRVTSSPAPHPPTESGMPTTPTKSRPASDPIPAPARHIHPLSSPTASAASSASSTPSQPVFSSATAPLPPAPNPIPAYSNYADPPLTMLAEVFTFHDRFASTTLTTTFSMISLSMTPFLDKLLPHLLHTTLSPSFILNIVRISKRNLFPNGYPGQQPPDPSPEEQAEMRARLMAWRPKGPLVHLLPVILGPKPSATLGIALDPLSSASCNLHLLVILLDRITAGLFPELTGGPGDN